MGTYKTDKSWHGIRQVVLKGRADPDAAGRDVKLPAAWGKAAADALAAMLPDTRSIDLALAAEAWIAPIAARAETAGMASGMGAALHALLAARKACPTAGMWQNNAAVAPGFLFNPSVFFDEFGQF